MNNPARLFFPAALASLCLSWWAGTAITQESPAPSEPAELPAEAKAALEKATPPAEEKSASAENTEGKPESPSAIPPKEQAGTAPLTKQEQTPTSKPVPKAQDETKMRDDSTPADSLPDRQDTLAEHDDCGLDFAEMKADPEKQDERGERVTYSGFTLKFGDEVSPFALMTVSVLPEAELNFEVTDAEKGEDFHAEAEAGTLKQNSEHAWTWKAPAKTGHYCIKISRPNSADMTCLQAFVMVPYKGEESLNGYYIGNYPDTRAKKDPVYSRPEGFIEVTEANLDTWVSPHFQLKQFLCKGHQGYPQYVIIRPRLLIKLEALLEEFGKAGLPAKSLYVMSAYRTPEYNRRIGNKTTLSRHTFGDAADVFIDTDRDGRIDDLNKDGKHDNADAMVLHDLVRKASTEGWRKSLVGGLSIYKANASRTAFIHVDTRGTYVTW